MTEPTGWQKFKYYTLGLTPPVSTREWVEHDINTVGWQIRRGAQYLIGSLVGIAIISRFIEGPATNLWGLHVRGALIGTAIGALIGWVLQMTIFRDYVRRRTLAYYRRKWDS